MRAEPRLDRLQVRREAEEKFDRELAAKRRGAEAGGSTLYGAPATAPAKDAATIPAPDRAAMTAHLAQYHALAKASGVDGVLVLVGFGEDPQTGAKIPSKVKAFPIGEVQPMVHHAMAWTVQPHVNVYVAPAVMRGDLPAGSRGGTADIVRVLGLVADYDDADAAHYATRVPLTPTYILQSSPGRYQTGFMLDPTQPLDRAQAEALAHRLLKTAQCDSGTKDVDHVWRIPGTLNWPNKKKLDDGRSSIPHLVVMVPGGTGQPIDPAHLAAALLPGTVENTPPDKAATRTTLRGACSLDDLTPAEQDAIATLRKDATFEALWNADYSTHTGDESKADFDFFCRLIRGTDCRAADRLEVIGRASGLYRDKWNRPDYLPRTIATALRDIPTARAEFGDTSGTTTPDTMKQTAAPNKTPRLFYELFNSIQPTLDRPALVEGLLDPGAFSVVYGETNSCKTFVVLDVSYCIATGRPFLGHAVERGAVLYVAAEGGGRIRNRFAALKLHYRDTGALLALVPCPIDLSGPGEDVQPLLDLMSEACRAMGRAPALLVIDTLARAIAGGNENSSEDMGAFVRNVDRLRHATKAHVLVIHHSGKDVARGARGHSSLRAATDTELEIADKTIWIKKQRDMEQVPPIGFDLKPLVIGQDARGGPVTSCVVIPRSLTAEHDFTTGRIKPGGIPRKALAILEDLTAGVGTVGVGVWKERFITTHYAGHSKAGWTAFERARGVLRKAGVVIEVAGRASCGQ